MKLIIQILSQNLIIPLTLFKQNKKYKNSGFKKAIIHRINLSSKKLMKLKMKNTAFMKES